MYQLTNRRIMMNKNAAIITCSVIALLASQVNALAKQTESEENDFQKEETVYALLQADGSVQKEIVSAHIHKDTGIKNVKETLAIKDVENLKGDEKPQIKDDDYTWNISGKDLYYQGISEKQLPVAIKVSYYLNGDEYQPQEIAGKSGKLEIHIHFTNTTSKQVSVQGRNTTIHPLYAAVGIADFDNEHFQNITCSNAKILSNGNQQLVSFFTLPGFADTLKSAGIQQADSLPITDDFVIQADVESFEMKPIMIAMTPEIPLEQIKNIDSFDELTNGVQQLTTYGLQLSDGTQQLSDATGVFSSKMNELKQKTAPLASAIAQLSNGTVQLYNGSNEISRNTKAVNDGIKSIKDGAQKLNEGTAGLGKLLDGIGTLKQGAQQLNAGIQSLEQGIHAIYTKAVASQQLQQLIELLKELEHYQDVFKYTDQLFNGIDRLNTALNIGNQSSINPDSPLPSVSAYTKTITANAQADTLRINALCDTLKAQHSDASLINECEQSANSLITHAQNTVILNTIINGEHDNGLAQQVKEMNQLLEQFDKQSFQQLQDQFTNLQIAIEGLTELNDALESLNEAAPKLSSGSTDIKNAISTLAASCNRLTELKTGTDKLYQGSETLYYGSKQLYQGTLQLSDALLSARNGIQQLHHNTPTLMNGITQLNDASKTLSDKTTLLNQGMQEFQVNGLDQLKKRVSLSTEDINRIMAIKDAVIEENKQIHSFIGAPEDAETKVKFIYKTEEIKQPQKTVEHSDQPEHSESFWDKIISFFRDLF